MGDGKHESTSALIAHVSGDGAGVDQLVGAIYDRLRGLARSYMKGERGYQTLEPTALVHEAYLRLIDINRVDWQGKSHFYAMAARQMRRILVERARAGAAKKRGGGARRVTLQDNVGAGMAPSLDLIALDEALEKLGKASPRQSKVVELRLFAGMQMNEIAHVLGVSDRTIKSDWKVARAWIAAELSPGQSAPS